MEIATIKNVQKIFPEISETTASRYIRYVRDVLAKPKPMILTIDEFKQAHRID